MSDKAETERTLDQERARTRRLYWQAVVQLKVDVEYGQRYRDLLAGRLTIFAVGRAVISGGALGSWIAGFGYPKLWGFVIVVSQVAEAALTALPLAARVRGLTASLISLDAAFIDALLEWQEIQLGNMEAPEISRRWHKLLRLRHETATKHLAAVELPEKPQLLRIAQRAAASYFETNYGVGDMS